MNLEQEFLKNHRTTRISYRVYRQMDSISGTCKANEWTRTAFL